MADGGGEVPGRPSGREVLGGQSGREVAGRPSGREVLGGQSGGEVAGRPSGREVLGGQSGREVAGRPSGREVLGGQSGREVAGRPSGREERGGRGKRDAGTTRAAPGEGLLELMAVMARLRRECPWDAEQTHRSLAPHLLEESYEALDALESGDPAAVREELGDVLLQVYFHAEIASERTDGTGYTIDDVAEGIAAKLVRRHPHVFSDVSVSGPDEVKLNWDAIKAAERQAKSGAPGSVLDGVPFGQPALALAAQLQRRAERAGVPSGLADLAVPDAPGEAAGADGAPGEAAGADGAPGEAAGADGAPGELGAELFALVARARAAGLDPELELRAAARAYRDRVLTWEEQGRRR